MLIVEQQSRAPDAAQRLFDGALQSRGPCFSEYAAPWVPALRRNACALQRVRDTRGDDVVTSHAVIARSPCDEAIQTASVAGFWIASAFAQASATSRCAPLPSPFSTNEACNKAVIQRN